MIEGKRSGGSHFSIRRIYHGGTLDFTAEPRHGNKNYFDKLKRQNSRFDEQGKSDSR